MKIFVNGVTQEITSGTTVLTLLKNLGIASEGIAVEINLTVINRNDYHAVAINNEDKVEVISFIGGGENVC